MTGLRKYKAYLWALGAICAEAGVVILAKLPETYISAFGSVLMGVLTVFIIGNGAEHFATKGKPGDGAS